MLLFNLRIVRVSLNRTQRRSFDLAQVFPFSQGSACWRSEAGRPGPSFSTFALLVVFVLIELGRIAEPQDLTIDVAGKDAVWPLRLERHDRHVPWAGPESSCHTAARQALERFELEDGRRRLNVIERPSWNCHTAPPSPVADAIWTPAIRVRQTVGGNGSCLFVTQFKSAG